MAEQPYGKDGKYSYPKHQRIKRDMKYKILRTKISLAKEKEFDTVKEIREAAIKEFTEKLNKELRRIEKYGGGIVYTFEIYALNYDKSFKDETDKRNSQECIEWRNEVFKRDNYTCVECGVKGNINAHHIKEWHQYPELRFDLDNGITLCVECHVKKHPGKENLIRKARYKKGVDKQCQESADL